MMRHIFGPVPSRRLGFSLGIDIIPFKYCSFDCTYCQIGKTTRLEVERESFFSAGEIADEVVKAVRAGGRVDHVTFSGSGEPTCNKQLGTIIRKIKKEITTPIAVITNGSLLNRRDVQDDLMEADVVLPSLDAASEEVFRRINRPHPSLTLAQTVEGIKAFRARYSGRIWLEIMLIKGVNDHEEELHRFRGILAGLDVDKIQLNTVTRPSFDDDSDALDEDAMERIRDFLGPRVEIIADFDGSAREGEGKADWRERIVEALERRSMDLGDIVNFTGAPKDEVERILAGLEEEGMVKRHRFGQNVYYVRLQSDG